MSDSDPKQTSVGIPIQAVLKDYPAWQDLCSDEPKGNEVSESEWVHSGDSHNGAQTRKFMLVCNKTGGKYPLQGFRFTIGRDQSAQIEIKEDPYMSRIHAIITQENGRFFIYDLGSTNGTFVNGSVVVQRTYLTHGARIKVGNSEFTFLQSSD